jgi:hypothetical protein
MRNDARRGSSVSGQRCRTSVPASQPPSASCAPSHRPVMPSQRGGLAAFRQPRHPAAAPHLRGVAVMAVLPVVLDQAFRSGSRRRCLPRQVVRPFHRSPTTFSFKTLSRTRRDCLALRQPCLGISASMVKQLLLPNCARRDCRQHHRLELTVGEPKWHRIPAQHCAQSSGGWR